MLTTKSSVSVLDLSWYRMSTENPAGHMGEFLKKDSQNFFGAVSSVFSVLLGVPAPTLE